MKNNSLSEQGLILKMELLAKAEHICNNENAIPEIDVPNLIRKELPAIDIYLKGNKNVKLNPEHIQIAKEVISESIKNYARIDYYSYNDFTAPNPKKPGLDYYDKRRDLETQYRGRYGTWIYDDNESKT